MKTFKTIDRCRLCRSDDLTFLFSLGEQYVNAFPTKDELNQGIKVPITLVLCRNCSLVQLQDTAPQEILYTRHYWYRSGVNATMRKALSDITDHVEELVDLKSGDVVLDIGSNDGTLLRSYKTDGIFRVGVEPASNLAEEGRQGVDVFIPDFWSIEAYEKFVHYKAKVITAIGMFYDLDDPNQFIADVAEALDFDGLFVAQLMCLKNMLNLNDVGNLAHEHLEFYSFNSLNRLFSQHGLWIFDIHVNDVNGESYRILAKKVGGKLNQINRSGEEGRINMVRTAEFGLDDPDTYRKFYQNLEENKDRVVGFIKEEVSKGKRVWVYGASTKGNVILQYFGLDHTLIEGAADRSPHKWGRYTVGTNIPIHSEEDARKANPDYFLVLPYSFIEEFVEREQAWLDQGGKFIVPIPKMEVIS